MVMNIVQKNIRNISVVNPALCAYSNTFRKYLIDWLVFTHKFIMVDFQTLRFLLCDIRTTVFRKTAQSVKEQVVVITQITPLIRDLV